MPTLIRKFPTAKFDPSADAEGEGTRGPLPRWDFCSPHFPAPSLSLHQARTSGCFIIFSQHRNELLGPAKNKSTKKMWKVPVLFFVLGRASLWVLADGKTQQAGLPAAAGGDERAGTCGNARAWYLRLPGRAEGSWPCMCAHESGGPGRTRDSGFAGARSQRKS